MMKHKTQITCPHCSYEWNTRGELKWATCPNCKKGFKKPVTEIKTNAELHPVEKDG